MVLSSRFDGDDKRLKTGSDTSVIAKDSSVLVGARIPESSLLLLFGVTISTKEIAY